MMQTQLKVIKADGSIEEYLYTKVVGTISNVLSETCQEDIRIAEQLAEAITYFLYNRQDHRSITSSEIFSIIKAVLTATGYEEAAIVLTEYHYGRRLKRSRTDVVSMDTQELTNAELFAEAKQTGSRCRWDKSRIVEDLVIKHAICRQTARTIASMVEEKIFNMGVTLVPSSLIKQLVLGDTADVLRAQQQLQTI